jgi:hypothetical protein
MKAEAIGRLPSAQTRAPVQAGAFHCKEEPAYTRNTTSRPHMPATYAPAKKELEAPEIQPNELQDKQVSLRHSFTRSLGA